MRIETKDLFKRFEDRARAVGWSVSELCRRSDVSRSTLASWRVGKNAPTLTVINKLEDALRPIEDALGIPKVGGA